MNSVTSASVPQTVPETLELRRELRLRLAQFMGERKMLAPLEFRTLQELTSQFLRENSFAENHLDWCMIFINNILWRDVIKRVPRSKRLLMLPFCLRDSQNCEATYDEFGLLCNHCGRCRIPELQRQAEELGLTTLVAESSSQVAEWVQSGEIQAVIGVSCLHSMAKAFPALNRNAVPGIAIPLNRAGCKDTDFDLDVLQEALAIEEEDVLELPSYDQLNTQVQDLFSPESLAKRMLFGSRPAEQFAAEIKRVMGEHGKHYRPMLTFQTWLALSEAPVIPPWLEPLALAVECFHKASLVHDDIEDDDPLRYGEPTVHESQGVAVAINLGDYLVGEGYRLLAGELVPPALRAGLLAAAAQGHCELALGQAQELEWRNKSMSLEMLLDTFRLKTAPAFRVALEIGALASGHLESYREVFLSLSEALGVAYQLLDDLTDKAEDNSSAVFLYAQLKNVSHQEARVALQKLYESYRQKAFAELEKLDCQALKSLLFRMTEKILDLDYGEILKLSVEPAQDS